MIHNHWWPFLQNEWKQPYFQQLSKFLHEQYATKVIFPPKDKVFSAFETCDLDDVKVVILGQDPYHEVNQAHGMCFSVNPGIPIPPSLNNIYKELHEDVGCYIPNNGYLMPWAKQGVFLLNTVMSVEKGKANSHAKKGWEIFTDHTIMKINDERDSVVFLLWGRNARNKASMIDQTKNLVLECAHPSPLSAYNGFFGCRHFSKTNAFLIAHNKTPIDWQIQNL